MNPRETARPAAHPLLFVGHGAPLLAIDAERGAPFRALGKALPRPRAILVLSAHWEAAPAIIGATETRPLIYDFYGFPAPLYAVKYPAPGAPDLAARVTDLLSPATATQMPARGLDHGAWTPLVHLYPGADVPVLQVSLPSAAGPRAVFALGQALAPLRDQGVLLIGSGNVTHNLRRVGPDQSPPEAFAAEFDAWVRETVQQRWFDSLLDPETHAPAYRMNHPTPDHYLPLVFAAGAARDGDAITFPIEGFEFQNLSRRAIRFG